jgi:adenine-specific DNA-methyltransferase
MSIAHEKTKKHTKEKSEGITYTPKLLADFVAQRMLATAGKLDKSPLRILDPAVGHGELLTSLLDQLDVPVEIFGFETDAEALNVAKARLSKLVSPNALHLKHSSFLDHILDDFEQGLFGSATPYDLIIANPPYVRTQVIGAQRAKELAAQFGLTGRVDLYHAFLLGMTKALSPTGTAGYIVSNRFMSTKGGATVRSALVDQLNLVEVYDLGDTKVFDAAVLPAVIIAQGPTSAPQAPRFTSIYQSKNNADECADNPIEALSCSGLVKTSDGRVFEVMHGHLDHGNELTGTWRLGSADVENWLNTVDRNAWGTFRDIGKIRVGVKTCADKVFLPKRWEKDLELLRPLTTHHIARRFRPQKVNRKILYPHETVDGRKQAVDLHSYPASAAYLESHREQLEQRKYVLDAGRNWYEIWVPQNPNQWKLPKLVFRDIAEEPTFWMDLEGTVVNGDCYWLVGDEELLWLALAVANSTFIEAFYDKRFNNKLYAGRRRFITQYVEQFPLPDPHRDISQRIVQLCRRIYESCSDQNTQEQESQLNQLVWDAFGLGSEKV